MRKSNLHQLTQAAVIAALYTGLTLLAAMLEVAYGPVQFRFSEALTILPALTPAAIPGLALGCFLGNVLTSPYALDWAFGTAATLLAAVLTRLTRNIQIKNMPLLAAFWPVVCNAVIIGAQITLYTPAEASWLFFATTAATVGAGQLVVCYLLGLPLYSALKRTKLFA